MTHHLGAIAHSPSQKAELSKIRVPTLVCHGTTDPLIPLHHAIEDLGFTYTLRKDKNDEPWKIIMGIIHDFDKAITL